MVKSQEASPRALSSDRWPWTSRRVDGKTVSASEKSHERAPSCGGRQGRTREGGNADSPARRERPGKARSPVCEFRNATRLSYLKLPLDSRRVVLEGRRPRACSAVRRKAGRTAPPSMPPEFQEEKVEKSPFRRRSPRLEKLQKQRAAESFSRNGGPAVSETQAPHARRTLQVSPLSKSPGRKETKVHTGSTRGVLRGEASAEGLQKREVGSTNAPASRGRGPERHSNKERAARENTGKPNYRAGADMEPRHDPLRGQGTADHVSIEREEKRIDTVEERDGDLSQSNHVVGLPDEHRQDSPHARLSHFQEQTEAPSARPIFCTPTGGLLRPSLTSDSRRSWERAMFCSRTPFSDCSAFSISPPERFSASPSAFLAVPTASDQPRNLAESNPPSLRPSLPESDIPANGLCRPSSRLANLQEHDTASQACVREFVSHTRGSCVGSSSAFPHLQQAPIALGNTAKRLTGLAAFGQETGVPQPLSQRRDQDVEACAVVESPVCSPRSARPQTSADILSRKGVFFGFQNAVKLDRSRFSETAGTPVWGGGSSEGIKRISQPGDLSESESRRENDKSEAFGKSRNLQCLRSESSQVVTLARPAVPASFHESRSSIPVVECMRDGQGKSVVGPQSRLPPRLVAEDSSASSRHSKERASSKRPREAATRSQGDMPVLLGCLSRQNGNACMRQLDFHRSLALSEKVKAVQGKQQSAVSRRDRVQEVEEEAENVSKLSHDRLEKQKNEMPELASTVFADAARERPADCFSRVKTASARSAEACAEGVEDRLHQKRDGEETRSWQGVAETSELAGDEEEKARDRESRGFCIREETTRDQDLRTSYERQCMQGSSRGERTTLSLSSFPMRSMHDFSKELEASLSRTLCAPSGLPAQEFNDSRGPNAVFKCYREKYAFNSNISVRGWKFDRHWDSMERTPRREHSSPLARSQSVNGDALSPVSRLSTQGHDMCCKSRTAAVSEPHYSCARASLSSSNAGYYISQDRRDTPLQSRFSGRASCTHGRGEGARDGTAEIQTWGENRGTERRLVELGGGPLATQLAARQSGERTPNVGFGEDVSPLCWNQRSPSSEWNAPEPEARHGWRFCRDFSRLFAEETESSLRVQEMQPRRYGDRQDAGTCAKPNTRKLLTRTVSAPGWEPRRSSWEGDGMKNGKRRENGCRRGVVSAPVCTVLERHGGEFSPFVFRSKKESVNNSEKAMRGVTCLSPTQSERTYAPRGDCEEALGPQVLRSKSFFSSSSSILLDDRSRMVSGGNEQTLEAETPKTVGPFSQAESWSRGTGSSPRSHISPVQLNQSSLSSRVSDPGPSSGCFPLSKGTRVGKEINGSKTDTLKQSAAYPEDSSISLEEVEAPKATVSTDRRPDENVPTRASLPVNDRESGSSTLSCSRLRMQSPHSHINRHSGGESVVGVLRTHADSRATAGEYHDGRGSNDLGDTNAWEERERTHVRSRLNTRDSKTSQKGAREEGPVGGQDAPDKHARECAKVLTPDQTEGIFLRSPTLSAPLPPRRTPSFDGGRGFTVSPVQKPVREAAENRCAQRGGMPYCAKSVSKNNGHSCCTKQESKKYSVSSPSRTEPSSRHCQWGHAYEGADTLYSDGFSGEKAETASRTFSSEEDLQTQTVEGGVSCRSKGRAEKRTDSLFEKGQLDGSTGGSPPSPISRREDAEISGRSRQSCRTHVDGSQETREDSSRTKGPSAPEIRPSKIQGRVDKTSRGSTAAGQDSYGGPQLRSDSADGELCVGKEGGRHKEALVMEKNENETSSRRFQVTARRSPALAEARKPNSFTKLGKDWEIQEAPVTCSFGEPSVLVRRIVWEVRPGRPICRCLGAPLSETAVAVDIVSAARAGSCTSSRGSTASAGFPFSPTDEKGTECEGGSVRLQQGTGTRLCVELLPCGICGGLPEAQFVNI